VSLSSILRSPSKTLASFLAVFCFGVALGPYIPLAQTSMGLMFILVPFAFAFVVPDRKKRGILLLIATLAFGIFRVQKASLPSHVITVADKTGISTRVEGQIISEVEERIDHQRVTLDHLLVADQSVAGRLLVQLPLFPTVKHNDTLVFNCTLQAPEPFNGFQYDKYLATRGILATCPFPLFVDIESSQSLTLTGSVLSIKSRMLSLLGKILPEPHASFLSGLLFGGSSSLSKDLQDDFRATGTSHILAASGFNISLFSHVFLAWILATRFGRRRGLILTSILLFSYVITAGATPAVIRAGIMGVLVLAEHWISRKASMTNALLLTAALMLLHNPLLLAADVGFQLSFVATVAVIKFTRPLSKHLDFVPKQLGIRDAFAGSLAAIGLTLPILLWHFGEISLIAPITNLFVLPLVVYAMATGLIALAVSFVSIGLGTIVALPTWALSTLALWLITTFGSITVATANPAHNQALAMLAAVLILLVLIRLYAKTTYTR
jgi:competence protein ComEC